MRDEPRERWPDVLLMLGDQVYADEVSPSTQSFIETRRDPAEPPGERVLDFEDYTKLYLESWSEPGDPLAPLHGLDDDDLRRSRRPRRLEHLAGVGRGGAQARVVERAHHGSAVVVLGLPAPREPGPRGPQGRRAADQGEGVRRRRGAAQGLRLPGRPHHRRRALELLPRPRPHAPDHDRLTRRPRARGGQALDARRRGVGLGERARHRRVRPPAGGHLAAVAARARAALRRSLERGGGGRRLGWSRRARGGEDPPGLGHGALGGLPGARSRA